MKEEHFGTASKPASQPASRRYEVVAGQYRICKLPLDLLTRLNRLSSAELERAFCAIDAFVNRRDLVAFSMYHRAPLLSLRGEQWTKIDGVKIFFFIDRTGDYVVFYVLVDEFDDDDGGGEDSFHFISRLDFDPSIVRGGSTHEPGLTGILFAWGQVAHEYAAQWVVVLSRVLLADQRDILPLQRLAHSCLSKFISSESDEEWQPKIVLNDLYCRDFRDISVNLEPVVLDVPTVWLEDDLADLASSPGSAASSTNLASGHSLFVSCSEQIRAELTLTQAPSGVWMIGLELAYLAGPHYLSAYVQLAAPQNCNHDAATNHDRSVTRPRPAGRLRVLLRR